MVSRTKPHEELIYGAWGPSTWGPSPAKEEEALRAQRREDLRADGFLAWLSLHPWVWALGLIAGAFAILGPWLHVLAPSGVGTTEYLCGPSPKNGALVLRIAPGEVLPGLVPGEQVTLLLNADGQVVGLGGPGGVAVAAGRVTGILDSVSSASGQLEITPPAHVRSFCDGAAGTGQALSSGGG